VTLTNIKLYAQTLCVMLDVSVKKNSIFKFIQLLTLEKKLKIMLYEIRIAFGVFSEDFALQNF
jgi:hypothetical protein